MALAILSVIAFLALIVWRFVFNGQQRRPVVREIGVPRQQDNSFLEQGLHILDLVGVALIPDNLSLAKIQNAFEMNNMWRGL